ncbi:hypothetical protein PTKIN_Ptkin06aG0197800 [Pterospermum kingtungense]
MVANETHSSRIEFPPLFNEKVAFPLLEQLAVYNLENCRKIWHDQLIGDSFSKLNKLWVLECNRLLNVFPFNMSKTLQNLEGFHVGHCGSLEEIFEPQVLNAHELDGVTANQSKEQTTLNFVFPKVTYLEFYKLSTIGYILSSGHHY